MKIKYKPEDFRVRELLDDAYLRRHGRYRVYRVVKRKRTSLEAAAVLADLAGLRPSDVGLAGLKDRQGITTQYMSVPKGRIVSLKTPELRIEAAGFAAEPLASEHSSGNAFEIVVRDLSRAALERMRAATEEVKAAGIPNYFGEQRFGNLRFGQGWIARDLLLGEHERALRSLLASPSPSDDARNARFKASLASSWGDWRACRTIAGKFGAHHSVFEHLARNDGDFAGAFQFVASRLRLIHLYAWQSHLWNRAVARYVEELSTPDQRITLSTPEGRIFFARGALPVDATMNNAFRLPGPRFEDVAHPRQRALLTEVLRREGLAPEQFSIDGVPGFQLKGEDRALLVHPAELELATPAGERAAHARPRANLRFTLPRGAYATVVLERLFAAGGLESPQRVRDDRRPTRGRTASGVHPRPDRRDARAARRDERTQQGHPAHRPRGAPRRPRANQRSTDR
jgi:tRNA pseudouridine13 synthase